MAIGDLLHQTPVTTPDPYTGCPVTRLTPPDHTSHHMYFYNRMVTSDSSRLLYCAEINGRRNLYLMELATGDAVQLTEGDALDDYGAMISADDKSVYYQQDRKVWKLDLATLQRTCLYAAPDGWDCGNWGMSDDNRYLVMTETRRDTLPDLTGKKGWEFFPLTCAAKPLCHIVYLDTQTGEHHIVVEDRCWFGHAQLRPGDPDTILFCHEGPYDMIDARLWLIQSDGSRYRCARPQPKDVIITHEFWMPTGDRLAYVYRKADDGSTETIRMMRPETLEETDRGTFLGRTVVVATGAEARELGVPGEAALRGRGVSYCATCDGMLYRGREVAIVGGGNTAVGDALTLARLAGRVTLIHRRDALRASAVYLDKLRENGVNIVWNTEVKALQGDDRLTGLVLRNKVTGEESTLPVDGLFVAVGRRPETALFRGQLETDEAGYLIADETTRTSLPGVYAVGDVRRKPVRQILTAAADGAVAAHYIEEYLAGNRA